jgi:hypothetical protein
MFIVAKKYGRTETRLKDFRKEEEAVSFIMEKLNEDIQFKIMATYCLYEGSDLLREYTQSDALTTSSAKEESESQAQGKGSGQSFRPTPFGTTPRIGPQSFVKNDEGKDGDDEENK